jgi:hypothetical protein
MSIEHKETHVEEIDDLLTEVFKEKPLFKAWLETYINQVQEIEDAFWELYIGRWLANATGTQLDNLGEIVGQERGSLDDDDYRVRIRVRIRLNYSSGTDLDIIEVFALLLGADIPAVRMDEYYPAGLVLVMTEYTSITPTVLAEVLEEARGAAINAQLIYLTDEADASFQCASGDTSETDSATGFADDAQTTGGAFADVLEA